MYAELRDWLRGGCIDDSIGMFQELTAMEYDYYGAARDKQILEPKEKLKQRLGRSPDNADALALTFAVQPARRDARQFLGRNRSRQAAGVDHFAFGW